MIMAELNPREIKRARSSWISKR